MTPTANTGKSERDRFNLHEAFAGTERQLLATLGTGREVSGHAGVQGHGTETKWQEMLKGVLPERYTICSAFVVDSDGGQSEQIDLAVVDRYYSPLFWEWGGHVYVPAESVYAVFEIKPEMSRRNLLYTTQKIASVRHLRRTSVGFGWAMGIMPAREPAPILGGFLAGGSEWSPPFGEAFHEALTDAGTEGWIDVGCVLGEGSFEMASNASTDGVSVGPRECALISFVLSLLRRLQAMGSASGIDYMAYASWLGEAGEPPG
jgi:hypothetical protein